MDELNEVDGGCCGVKGNKRKYSDIYNRSTVSNGVSTVDGNESERDYKSDMDLFYWDNDDISCNSSINHNVLDVNFNELLINDDDNESEIKFDNVSPKLHINMLSFEF